MRASKLRKERANKKTARIRNSKLLEISETILAQEVRESENLAKKYLLKQKTLAKMKKKADAEFPEIVK